MSSIKPPEKPVSRSAPTHTPPPNTPSATIFTYEFTIYEADKDSFSVGGNRYYTKAHGFSNGDRVRVAISRVAGSGDKIP